MTKFTRIELRTTDTALARQFYAKILGHERAVIWPLHENALARGASPHWLGHLGVDDVEGKANALVERGAVRLGPTLETRDGGTTAVLRDPGGAVVALTTSLTPTDAGVEAAWHVLNSRDAARAAAQYSELFGWKLTDPIELGPHGVFQQFAWQSGGPNVGAIGDIAHRPGVHPHWLFFFEVDSLDLAMADTRAAGGLVAEAGVLPSGARFCVCDDPEGAAFALRERTVL